MTILNFTKYSQLIYEKTIATRTSSISIWRAHFPAPMSNGYYSEILCQMNEKMVSNFNFRFSEYICIYSLSICKHSSVKCPFYTRVAYLFLINLKTLWYIRDMKSLSGNSWQLFLPVYDSSLHLFMNALYHRKFVFIQIC